jgi:hypothetical protein
MNLGNRNYLDDKFGCKKATTLAIPGTLGIRRRTIAQLFGALALLRILCPAVDAGTGEAYRQWILWTLASRWRCADIV